MTRLAPLLLILATAATAPAAAPPVGPRYARLPQSLSSLGACACDGWLYVYGGHTGRTHAYSTRTASGRFLRIPLGGGTWEELPGGPPLQGLALVAHRGRVYRVGGMQPRNAPGTPPDNHSVASVACYEPKARKWFALPNLPAGRSSHDAAFLGDSLVVVGGWSMRGKTSRWLHTVDVLDFTTHRIAWRTRSQPFARRALAAAALAGRLYVLGGLPEKGPPTRRVDVFDPMAGKWRRAPDLPGKDSAGFSPAACVAGGELYVSGNDGRVWRLDRATERWEHVGTQKVARFVHRLVPGGPGRLIVIGGAAHEGDSRLVEEVVIPERKGTAAR